MPTNAYQSNPYSVQPINNTNIVWVKGMEAVNAYHVSPGQTISLWDMDEEIIYIKSVDNTGMLQPIRIFDYKERVVTPKGNYITEERLNEILDEKLARLAQRNNYNNKKKYYRKKGDNNEQSV